MYITDVTVDLTEWIIDDLAFFFLMSADEHLHFSFAVAA